MIQEFHSRIYLWKKTKNTNPKRYMHLNVYSSPTYNSQDKETTKCPLADNWTKEMWHVCVWNGMEYYSAIKKNEILIFTATWMHLESIMLS